MAPKGRGACPILIHSLLRLLECGLGLGHWGLSFMGLDGDMEWRVGERMPQ